MHGCSYVGLYEENFFVKYHSKIHIMQTAHQYDTQTRLLGKIPY